MWCELHKTSGTLRHHHRLGESHVGIICPRGSILQLLFHASEIHWQYALALSRPTRPSLNWTVVLREMDYFDEGVFFVGVFKRVDSLPFNCFLFSSVKQTNTIQFITKELLPCSVNKMNYSLLVFEQGHPFRSLFLGRLWVGSCREQSMMPCFCTCEICDNMHLC